MDNFNLSGKTLLKNISTFFMLEKLIIYQEGAECREEGGGYYTLAD